ncbi:MAG: hypothetical protein RLZZ458_2302 [Planctomycetota bacterium]
MFLHAMDSQSYPINAQSPVCQSIWLWGRISNLLWSTNYIHLMLSRYSVALVKYRMARPSRHVTALRERIGGEAGCHGWAL